MERLLPRQHAADLRDQRLDPERAAQRPDDGDPFLSDVSLIDESYGRFVRMGHLAFLGARKVNGVSALHGELMKQTVFHELHRLFPDRITAITNGVTPRRWVLDSNPGLADLITETLGRRWIADLERLEELAPRAADPRSGRASPRSSGRNKERLASFIAERHRHRCSTRRAVRRAHQAHPRVQAAAAQHPGGGGDLRRHRDGSPRDWVPRVKIFAGKAAPSYLRAKLIIKLHQRRRARWSTARPRSAIGSRSCSCRTTTCRLAEILIPAADLSEQISTAGMEASGTGNMKFGLNGALTIGTLDGANIEMREHVGADNIFIFGLTAEEVAQQPPGRLLADARRSRPARASAGRSS